MKYHYPAITFTKQHIITVLKLFFIYFYGYFAITMSYFSLNYNRINYPFATETTRGLRNAQLGAIYAIGSHFTLYKNDPAIVIMPTGAGKTAVLNLAAYQLRAKRVLVLSSSIAVRGQIVEEFQTLKTLKSSNVFHNDLSSPKVKEIKSPIKSITDWEELKEFDVIIGIPNSINYGISESIKPESTFFDLVLVDEAHHVPAFTWTNIVQHFKEANKIFFTATPFRRDKKEIEGRVAFNYPLRRAYEDKIFGDIGYYPVEVKDIHPDLAIAKAAEDVFLADKQCGLKHYLMVRTETKDEAEKLIELYANNTSLKLKKVDSTISYSTIKKTIQKLKNGELDGIICVDMLGEGFDFPNLKIAAIHSPKKSLANTLQFIGRFARTNADNIGEAKFLAIPNDITIGKKLLYQEGAIWNDIIKNLSEEKIEEEDEIKRAEDTFEKASRDNIKENISFYHLNPYYHVKVYKTNGIKLDQKLELNGLQIIYHAVSKDYNSVVCICRDIEKPKWIASDEITNINHFLFLLYFDELTNLLFINSTIKTQQFYEQLVQLFAIEPIVRISKSQINKVLLDISNTEFFNIGMQSKSANSGESYRIIAGSNAENTIKKSHGKNYANGHVFLKGEDKGDKITIGYSSGAKIWSNTYEKIPFFIKWCKQLGAKINSSKTVKTNTGFDNLPIGQVVDIFPHKALAANWHHDTFTRDPTISAIIEFEELWVMPILDFEIQIDFSNSTSTQVAIDLISENETISLAYDFDKHYSYRIAPSVEFKVNDSTYIQDLLSYLNENPLALFLENFATVMEHEYFAPPEAEFRFDANRIIPFDWQALKTDIKREFYETLAEKISNSNRNSIHDSLKEKLVKENSNVLIYDHGTGEIADYITISESDEIVAIGLYHVKGSKDDQPGDRVDDVYEVCMQAVKSQSWTPNKQTFEKKVMSRVKDKPQKFILGNLKVFTQIMSTTKRFTFTFTIVQPGISAKSISDKITYVLAATDDSISNNGNESLVILGS